MIQVLVSFFGGYLIGSVPFAYLITRAAARTDIRAVGSGNVGGYNTYVVTKSKGMALAVVLLDMAKGFAAVWVSSWLLPNSYLLHCIALIGAVGGHNYSIWLGFKGGMGLATGIGATAVAAWPALLFAGVTLALIRFTVLRHSPRAVIAAALITIPAAWLMRFPPATFALVAGVCALIAARHTIDWNRRYAPAD